VKYPEVCSRNPFLEVARAHLSPPPPRAPVKERPSRALFLVSGLGTYRPLDPGRVEAGRHVAAGPDSSSRAYVAGGLSIGSAPAAEPITPFQVHRDRSEPLNVGPKAR
jgi:hypothetical protein